MLVLFSLLLIRGVFAGDTPVPAPAEPAAPSAEPAAPPPAPLVSANRQRLNTAVQRYLDGDPSAARAELQALLGLGPDLEADVRRDALAWLGDILFSEEGEHAAQNAFETLLAEDPTYTLDSFQHPPEVVVYFEKVKQGVLQPPPPPRPTPRPFPTLALVPGGVYYYTQGKPVIGATLTTLQVGCLAGSVVLYTQRRAIPLELDPGQEALVAKARTLQALNWTVAAAGWASLVIPIFVETSRWGSERSQIRLSTDGQTVQVGGSF